MGTGFVSCGQSDRSMNLTTYLQLVPRLRMIGAIILLSIYAFKARTGKSFAANVFFILETPSINGIGISSSVWSLCYELDMRGIALRFLSEARFFFLFSKTYRLASYTMGSAEFFPGIKQLGCEVGSLTYFQYRS
jgi:hypothetical protein